MSLGRSRMKAEKLEWDQEIKRGFEGRKEGGVHAL
jgi:hypothetical protein